MKTVYLAGRINKCNDDECKSWREKAKSLLKTSTHDPMDRDFRGKEDFNVTNIVKGDLADIGSSYIVLVNAEQPSWGTAMEIVYAYEMGKLIFAFGAGDKPSPWLVYHCSKLFNNVEDACTHINSLFSS